MSVKSEEAPQAYLYLFVISGSNIALDIAAVRKFGVLDNKQLFSDRSN
jgi:hypothetical protein